MDRAKDGAVVKCGPTADGGYLAVVELKKPKQTVGVKLREAISPGQSISLRQRGSEWVRA